MLIFLVLCLTAILPTGLSDPVLGPQQLTKNEGKAHHYSVASNLGIYVPAGKSIENNGMHETVIPMPGGFINGRENEIYFSNDPEDRILWIYVPAIMNAMSNFYRMMKSHRRGFDETFEDEHEMSRDARLDPIGGGHLLKRAPALDSIGGGHLLKRAPILDQIGGGHLLKRESRFKQFLTSGNAAKRRPVLDSIGGGHLLKRVVELKQFYPTESGDDYEKKLEDTLTEENIDPRRNQ